MKTKLFALLFAVVASTNLIFAENQYGIKIGDYYYNLYDVYNYGYGAERVSFLNCAGVTSNPFGDITDYSSLTSVNIPESVIYNNQEYTVRFIEPAAFGNMGFTFSTVTMPNTLISIGSNAFTDCNHITNVTLPNGVKQLEQHAFSRCENLSFVSIGDSTKYVEQAFAGCINLSSITISDSNPYLDSRDNCNAIIRTSTNTLITGCKNTIIPNTVIRIEQFAFEDCRNLTNIEIPTSVQQIGKEAFRFCTNLNQIVLPDGITTLEWGVFSECFNLKSVIIPPSVDSIADGAFLWCDKLESVTIPANVRSIGHFAFRGCNNLKSVTLPGKVREIGCEAFDACGKLSTIFVESLTPPTICSPFPSSVTVINVPYFTKGIYETTEGWIDYAAILQEALLQKVDFISDKYGNATSSYISSISAHIHIMSLTATPLYGCHFVHWGDGITDNPRTIELTQDTTFKVVFAPNPVIVYKCDSVMGNIAGDTITPTGIAADSITFEAVSNYGYHFVQWNDNVRDSIRTIYLTKDTTFTAEFARNPYSVITKSANPIMGITSGDTSALYIDSISIVGLSNYGYHFAQWSDGVTDNPRTFVLTQDTSFTAEFSKNVYAIEKQADSIRGNIAGLAQAEYLDTISIDATPNYGYHFTQWGDSISDNPRTFVLTQDTTFTAEFARNTYTITAESSNVEWGITSGDTSTLYLDTISLTAIPHYGYHFVRWNDNDTTYNRKVVVTKDETYRAIFEKNTYTISKIYDATCGYIAGVTQAYYLDSIIFEVIPNYGYHFVQWSDSVIDNPRSFVLTQDTTFAAEFTPNYYSLRTETNYSERGTTQGDTIAPYLTSIQISATPNYGYYFDSWSDGNHYNPRSMNLRGDTTFTAYFEKIEYAVSIIADSTMGIVSGVSRANYLDTLTILATPNHGYHFVQWSDSVTDNPRTFVLTRDTAFTAEFAQTFAGQCGDSLYWNFNNDSLVFSGSGDMYNYVPDSLPWALLINQTKNIEFAQEMTSISAYAFQNMGNLSKLNLSAKIFTIGDFAFENCSLLNYVTIPNSVISLGDSAFNGCSSIDTLIIGTGIRTITNQFRGCTNLRYVQLGKNIQNIDYGSFYDARQLIFIVSHPTLPPLAYPDEVGKERSFYNTNAQVLIPCDNFDAYQYDALWGSFNLKCLSSNSGTAVDGQVMVVAGDADATFTWPTDGSAETYNLEITKDSATFCSLIFDSEGRLLGIAFAPSANGQQPHMPAATMTTKGMSFKVTGLDYASQYRFSFETKDDNTQTIFAYTGGFHTNGTDAPEGFNDINAEDIAPRKVMIDGQIFILRGDKIYTIQGQEVK